MNCKSRAGEGGNYLNFPEWLPSILNLQLHPAHLTSSLQSGKTLTPYTQSSNCNHFMTCSSPWSCSPSVHFLSTRSQFKCYHPNTLCSYKTFSTAPRIYAIVLRKCSTFTRMLKCFCHSHIIINIPQKKKHISKEHFCFQKLWKIKKRREQVEIKAI